MLADMNIAPEDDGASACDRSPCIYLSSAQCEALGLLSPPPAGTRVSLRCVATFQIVTQSADEEGEPADVSATLKITHMSVDRAPASPTLLYKD